MGVTYTTATGATYVPLALTTVTGTSTTTVTLGSISSAYTDLRLVVRANTSVSAGAYFYFNGDNTSGLYSDTILRGNGTAATSTRQTANNNIPGGTFVDYVSGVLCTVDVMNYTNTSVYKTCLIRANDSATGLDANVGLWRNANAINSISFTCSAGYFVANSTFALYGILGA